MNYIDVRIIKDNNVLVGDGEFPLRLELSDSSVEEMAKTLDSYFRKNNIPVKPKIIKKQVTFECKVLNPYVASTNAYHFWFKGEYNLSKHERFTFSVEYTDDLQAAITEGFSWIKLEEVEVLNIKIK